MTMSEFKSWFDGFNAALAGPPDARQWACVKARVAQIDGIPVTQEFTERGSPSLDIGAGDFEGTTAMLAVGRREAVTANELAVLERKARGERFDTWPAGFPN